MIVIMKNIVKKLSALDYELHTPFRYFGGTDPVCKQNYKKYLQVLLQDRCVESKLDLFYLHCHSLYDLHYNVHAMPKITKTKRQSFFCNLRIFLWYATLQLGACVLFLSWLNFQVSEFLSTFFAKIANSPKFSGF